MFLKLSIGLGFYPLFSKYQLQPVFIFFMYATPVLVIIEMAPIYFKVIFSFPLTHCDVTIFALQKNYVLQGSFFCHNKLTTFCVGAKIVSTFFPGAGEANSYIFWI